MSTKSSGSTLTQHSRDARTELPALDSLFGEVCGALDREFRACTRKEPNANRRWTSLLRDRLSDIAVRHGLQQAVVVSDNTAARVALQWTRGASVVAELGWEWEAGGVDRLLEMAGSDAPLKVYMTDCAKEAVASKIKDVCRIIAEGKCMGSTLVIVFTAVSGKQRSGGQVCMAHKVVIQQDARPIARRIMVSIEGC